MTDLASPPSPIPAATVRAATHDAPAPLPLVARILLVDAARVEARLARLRDVGAHPAVPNAWQITLGIARMWHRVIFRSSTIGTSASHRLRPTWRARLLASRPIRFPFLLAERAIAPLDFSGLLSSRPRIVRHLLGAHHDARQFAYDLELLATLDRPALDEALASVRDLLARDSRRARWLRDLVVYEGYHEDLEAAVTRALEGDFGLTVEERTDPDIAFGAYLAWCARQPPTPAETWALWRAGRYTVAEGSC
jgi:hypothetical protein